MDPIGHFSNWLAEAEATEPSDANACALATVEDGPLGPRPDVRIVLMKHHDADGFIFYSNFDSAKGRQLAACPWAALDFHWKSLRRQVRISGSTHIVGAAVADAYFATRPRLSQLSAWASEQSRPLDHRETFEARLAAIGVQFPTQVPRPPFWGGWRLTPERIEFWEERDGRQHHRECYTRQGAEPGDWQFGLLYP
jgi:pyridoxamine 5'-phosphate oxidase